MPANIKRLIKSCLHKTGFELCRLSPSGNPAFQLLKGLEHFGIDLVFDIGANRGQFATELLTVGYHGRIVSFEPLEDAHHELARAASKTSRWDVHARCAVGDTTGELEFNIAGNSVSSSALPILDAHVAASLSSAYVGKVTVPSVCLDAVADPYLALSERYFIKIDTQGYEWQVLEGARHTLAGAAGVLCELSLVPLYEGQKLWLELIHRLQSDGFTLWAIQKGFTDKQTGRTLQVNAVFFRTDS